METREKAKMIRRHSAMGSRMIDIKNLQVGVVACTEDVRPTQGLNGQRDRACGLME